MGAVCGAKKPKNVYFLKLPRTNKLFDDVTVTCTEESMVYNLTTRELNETTISPSYTSQSMIIVFVDSDVEQKNLDERVVFAITKERLHANLQDISKSLKVLFDFKTVIFSRTQIEEAKIFTRRLVEANVKTNNIYFTDVPLLTEDTVCGRVLKKTPALSEVSLDQSGDFMYPTLIIDGNDVDSTPKRAFKFYRQETAHFVQNSKLIMVPFLTKLGIQSIIYLPTNVEDPFDFPLEILVNHIECLKIDVGKPVEQKKLAKKVASAIKGSTCVLFVSEKEKEQHIIRHLMEILVREYSLDNSSLKTYLKTLLPDERLVSVGEKKESEDKKSKIKRPTESNQSGNVTRLSRLRESFERAYAEKKNAQLIVDFKNIIVQLLENIINKEDEKFRVIKRSNAILKAKLFAFREATAVLETIGFIAVPDAPDLLKNALGIADLKIILSDVMLSFKEFATAKSIQYA
eukprot:TRINITY_DN31571_c0_g1_i1.p1 TRINITY_DN31571_c0_g1~~TRINITY_DN31571_c0_g1_i1.p1  ORF type:complete len:460 (+),score=85.79 TRINITY_DN31571_c0_g1_i1:44-1423(+)